jgi:hypothetical protein
MVAHARMERAGRDCDIARVIVSIAGAIVLEGSRLQLR